MSLLIVQRSIVAAADLNLEVVAPDDVEVNFIGFSRTTAEAITIEMSVTVDGITTKLIEAAASTAKDAAITDVFRLPAGSTVRVKTTGALAGALNAVIVLDPRTLTGG